EFIGMTFGNGFGGKQVFGRWGCHCCASFDLFIRIDGYYSSAIGATHLLAGAAKLFATTFGAQSRLFEPP
ncbi:MAG: hypothetical protein M0P19_11370, partial [Nevskia sp.]|nr:hypothetical protein [Nevskia sp.]